MTTIALSDETITERCVVMVESDWKDLLQLVDGLIECIDNKSMDFDISDVRRELAHMAQTNHAMDTMMRRVEVVQFTTKYIRLAK